MKIKVDNIKTNIYELNKLISNYENFLFNNNNLLLNVKKYWAGEKSELFFAKTNSEHKKIYSNIQELKSLVSIYNDIVNEYQNIGNDIFFNSDEEKYVSSYFDEYIQCLKEIIILYNNIPYKYNYLVENDKNYFHSLIDQVNEIRNKYNTICNNIKKIENSISIKISKMNVEIIKESDIRNLM